MSGSSSNSHHNDEMDFTQTSGFEYMNLGDASEAERKVIYDILFKNPQTAYSQETLFKDLRPHPGEYLSSLPQAHAQIHNHQDDKDPQAAQNHHVPVDAQQMYVTAAQASVMQVQQQQHQQNGPVISTGTQVLMMDQQGAGGRPGAYYPSTANIMTHQGPIHIPFAAYASQINQGGPPHGPPPPHHMNTFLPPHAHYMPQFIIPGAVPVSSAQGMSMGMGGDEGKGHGHHDQSAGGQRPRSKGQSPRGGSSQRRNDEQQQQTQHYPPQGYYQPAGNYIYYPNPNGGPTPIILPAAKVTETAATNGPISLTPEEPTHEEETKTNEEASVVGAPEEQPEPEPEIPAPEEPKIDETPAPIPTPAPVTTQLEVQIETTGTTGSSTVTPTPKTQSTPSPHVHDPQPQSSVPPKKQESNPDFPVLGALPNGPPSQGPPAAGRSWASIAKSNAPPSLSSSASSTTNGPLNGLGRAITPDPKSFSSLVSGSSSGELMFSSGGPALSEASYQSMDEDPLAYQMGEFLAHYTLNHHSFSLTPRGLSNQGNWCYINATLQSLIACPPMVHLFRDMEKILGRKICKSSPIIQSVYEFVLEFEPITRYSQSNKNKRPQDAFFIGASFEPSGIRRVLGLLDGATFKVEGRQEDAEEFLSHLLNGLHDEMTKLIKFYETKRERRLIGAGPSKSRSSTTQTQQSVSVSTSTSGIPTTNGETVAESETVAVGPATTTTTSATQSTATTAAEDEEWQVMGPKNKGSMTRKTETSRTPISEMFLGQYSSLLHRGTSAASQTPKTTTLQPFFTLQLDIQDDNIHNVRDALDGLSAKEELTSGSTGLESPMWKQLSLEVLPIILVVHLKRFVYDKTTSKISKLTKRVDFGIDLEIGKDLLSLNCKSKISNTKQRFYKLFAAVYHDGEDAHKGHYIADTFHPSGGSLWGQFGWIRYDDTSVKGIPDGHILCPAPPRVPYLLYYRRVDTLNPPKKSQDRERDRYDRDRQGQQQPNQPASSSSSSTDNRQ